MQILSDANDRYLSFNTGRGYSPDGQVIHASIMTSDEDGILVAFWDETRYVAQFVVVDVFRPWRIMEEYDCCAYVHNHPWLDRELRDTGRVPNPRTVVVNALTTEN